MANFNIISQTLKTVLDFIVGIVGNYGWSVVIFTLLIRLLVLPLDIQSKKAMKRQQQLQPKLDALNKKYANDKEKLGLKQQELYKKEGINPLASCLPMLLSFPILICMFTAMRVTANEQMVQMLLHLKEGIEPTFQSWFWIKNVFQPDSFMASILPAVNDALASIQGVNGSAILTAENVALVKEFVTTPEYAAIVANYGVAPMYTAPLLMWTISIPQQFNGLLILPLLAAGTQFISAKLLNAAQPQTAQTQSTSQMMNLMMPAMSLIFCLTSNAAFAIYWVAVNIITSVQQYVLNVYFDRKEANDTKEVIQP